MDVRKSSQIRKEFNGWDEVRKSNGWGDRNLNTKRHEGKKGKDAMLR